MSKENIYNRIDRLEVKDEIKGILREMFDNLYSRQDDELKRISERVEQIDAFKKTGGWAEIHTALADKGTAVGELVPVDKLEETFEDNGDDSVTFTKFAFLDCDYKRFDEILSEHRTYSGKITYPDGKTVGCDYTISYSDKLVNAEDFLFTIGQIYGITDTCIYSPWSRRLVQICAICDARIKDHWKQFDLCLCDNGLDGISLLENKILLWNIFFDDTKVIYPEEEDCGGERIYTYVHPSIRQNTPEDPVRQYLALDPEKFNQLRLRSIKTDDQGTKITAAYFIDSTRLSSFFRICEIKPFEQTEKIKTYCNAIKAPHCLKKHIFSAGDVSAAVKAFERSNVSIEFCRKPADIQGQKVKRYNGELYCCRDNALSFVIDKPVILTVKFQFNETDNFNGDYAEFVLHSLERRYPEYRWEGILI